MKKTIIIPLMMILMLMGLVNAEVITLTSVTLVTPAASGTIEGTYRLNSTTVGGTSNVSLYNITYEAISPSTVNSSTVTIATLTDVNVSELSSKESAYDVTYATGGLIDSNDYTITVTIVQSDNASNSVTDSSTSVIVDNTVPICSQTTLVSNTQYDIGNKTFFLNVTGTNATSGTSAFDGNTKTLTEAREDMFSVNIGTLPTLTYDVTISTSDGSNTTTCTALTDVTFTGQRASVSEVTVDLEQLTKLATGKSTKNIRNAGIVLAVFVVIIITAAKLNNKKQ